MRLWTLHPRYLDDVALRAAWDDAWAAWLVVFRPHRPESLDPQLDRWRATATRENLSWFMTVIAREMLRRGTDPGSWPAHVDGAPAIMTVTAGQVAVERAVLLRTLDERGRPDPWMELAGTVSPDVQPMFKVVPGGPEPWETAPEATTIKIVGRDR